MVSGIHPILPVAPRLGRSRRKLVNASLPLSYIPVCRKRLCKTLFSLQAGVEPAAFRALPGHSSAELSQFYLLAASYGLLSLQVCGIFAPLNGAVLFCSHDGFTHSRRSWAPIAQQLIRLNQQEHKTQVIAACVCGMVQGAFVMAARSMVIRNGSSPNGALKAHFLCAQQSSAFA